VSETAEEALRRLEERLQRASGAAERLFSEAAASATAAATGREAPPQGFEASREEERPGDLELLIGALEAIGDLIPADLRRRLAEAVREVLLAVRALIDWYLERTESRSDEPPEVQDIPVI
jgi:hypothetical protein